jgi:hypothetical protein
MDPSGIAPTTGVPIAPIPDICITSKAGTPLPNGCPPALAPEQFDGLPDVELFDRTGSGTWHRLTRPSQGQTYDLADPARYVDPATGTLIARYVNDQQDQVNFSVNVAIEGSIK